MTVPANTRDVTAADSVLIVDDSEEIREDIAFVLGMEGMKTSQAEDGIEALSLIQENRPSLIICDLMMPEMDGFALLRSLRSDPAFWNIPVLVISAMDNRKTMRQVMQLGADDFLGKPFTHEELVDAVKMRMERQSRVMSVVELDPGTSLLHRDAFITQLQRIGSDADDGARVAAVMVSLTYFDRITTLFGSDVGEGVVAATAERLRAITRTDLHIGYLGVGTFALCMPFSGPETAFSESLARDLAFLKEPPPVADRDRRISITWTGVHCSSAELADSGAAEVIASLEMLQEGSRRPEVVPLAQATASRALTKLALPQLLRAAIEDSRDGFTVAWQPQVDATSFECRAAEVLLRWDTPEFGAITPAEFVRIAESWGLINQLAAIGLSRTVEDLRGPLAEFLHLKVGVNVSPLQLAQEGFAGWLLETLDQAQIDPQRITVEITETLTMECVADPAAVLAPMRDAGIQIALDDFGTGFSSLSLLHDLRVDELKIDRAFVADMESDSRSADLCQNIIRTAHDLGARVVAEGVENPAQRDLLRDLGCDLLQGYYFSKPVSAQDFAGWLRDRS